MRLVLRVDGFGTVVEIEAMPTGCGDMRRYIVLDDAAGDRPMRGDAPCPAENLGKLHHRVRGDQAAHARPHHERVRRPLQRTVLRIDERLQFGGQEGQVGVGDDLGRRERRVARCRDEALEGNCEWRSNVPVTPSPTTR